MAITPTLYGLPRAMPSSREEFGNLLTLHLESMARYSIWELTRVGRLLARITSLHWPLRIALMAWLTPRLYLPDLTTKAS